MGGEAAHVVDAGASQGSYIAFAGDTTRPKPVTSRDDFLVISNIEDATLSSSPSSFKSMISSGRIKKGQKAYRIEFYGRGYPDDFFTRQPTDARLTEIANQTVTNGEQYVNAVLDHWWPLSGPYMRDAPEKYKQPYYKNVPIASTDSEKRADIAQFAQVTSRLRAKLKTAAQAKGVATPKICWNAVPFRDYDAGLDKTSQAFKDWQHDNDLMSELVAASDMLCPVIYVHKSDPSENYLFAKNYIEEVRRISQGKPVIVTMWSNLHPFYHPEHSLVPLADWKAVTNAVFDYADGLTLWDDPTASWIKGDWWDYTHDHITGDL